MTDPRLSAISQMQNVVPTETTNTKKTENNTPPTSFGETLKRYIDDANDLQISADRDIQRIIAGEDIDAHEVMNAVEKASISFEMVMEIKNKMLEAYREVVRMGV